MRAAWLLRQGDVLASAEVRQATICSAGHHLSDGALVVRGVRLVHTSAARGAVDTAFCDAEMVVVTMSRLRPWRIAVPPRGTRTVVHAPAGSFERWGLRSGDKLELRETQ